MLEKWEVCKYVVYIIMFFIAACFMVVYHPTSLYPFTNPIVNFYHFDTLNFMGNNTFISTVTPVA